MAEAMFDVRHVTFGYSPETEVLRDVSLTVPRGAYAVLLGANGSGKSTLARHLNGLLLPRTGQVFTAGLDTASSDHILPIRQQVGMVFQHPDNQIVATTVEDDVAFGLENLGVPPDEIEDRVTWALGETGLVAMRHRPPHLLSGGQKQRLAIASALAMRQQAIIMDEVTASLDSAGRKDILDLIERLNREGVTLLTVTHRMDEVLPADLVFVLSQGQVVLEGTPRAVFSQTAELRRLNLTVPDIAAVAGRLHEKLPALSPGSFTPEELLADLRRFHGVGPQAPQLPEVPAKSGDHGPPPHITVRDLGHVYMKGTPLEHTGLTSASLDIAPGEAVAVVGATGCGKSTVMQHLNGLLRPQTGRVVSLGVDLGQPHADVALVRRNVGLLFQNPEDQLFEQLVGDDVAYGPFQAKWPRAKVREHVAWAMNLVGLDFDTFKDRPVFALSGGEKRKAALAGVLALRPKVLVLDEPTAGLDPKTADELIGSLHRLKEEGTSVVFVTHNMDEVLALADRIVIMTEGRTVQGFRVEEVIARPERLEAHGFAVPPLLKLLQGARALGLGPLMVRGPDEAADEIAAALSAIGALRERAGGSPA